MFLVKDSKLPCWTRKLNPEPPLPKYVVIGKSFSLIIIVGVVVPIDSLNVAVILTTSEFLMRLSVSLSVKVTVSGATQE